MKSTHRPNPLLLFCATLLGTGSFLFTLESAGSLEPGENRTTFDPFGKGEEEPLSEADALEKLRTKWTISMLYTFTHRKDFPVEEEGNNLKSNATEQLHLWALGLDYRPWSFFFTGASVPLMKSKFERYDVTQHDETGLGDLATYIGTQLPVVPLTLTGMLLWPTGDFEKGMGTGTFSGGALAHLDFATGTLSTKIGGFYFFVGDPEPSTDPDTKVQSLPNTYGADASVSIQANARVRTTVGFSWSYATLITGDSVHQFKLDGKAGFRVFDWLYTSMGFGWEFYPTKAIIPMLALVCVL